MGYTTYFHGEILIDPPIPWAEIKDSVFTKPQSGRWFEKDIKFRIEEEPVDTPEGTLIRRQAVAIVCSMEDEPRDHGIEGHLQELLNAYGEGRTFAGRLDAEGDAAGDLWRLQVRDGRAVRVEPRIVWPDEESTVQAETGTDGTS